MAVNKSTLYKNESQKNYDITEAKREQYRKISHESRLAKRAAEQGLFNPVHAINKPRFCPNTLMPQLAGNGLNTVSLFCGGGGLDLGFDRAGYMHRASYELIPICGDTFRYNRPEWDVFVGPDHGDVTQVDWRTYQDEVDVVHGGPPCQPFSVAGQQKGHKDPRNMWDEFSRAINTIKPKAFVAENVLGIKSPKFADFVKRYIYDGLSNYHIQMFEMNSADFGVPQIRRRIIFVGFKNKKFLDRFHIPVATHSWSHLVGKSKLDSNAYTLELFPNDEIKTMGVRAALGLEHIGCDSLAPTLRSGFTGKRNTTSILNLAQWRSIYQAESICVPSERRSFPALCTGLWFASRLS